MHSDEIMTSIVHRNRTAFKSFNMQINPIGDEFMVILSKAFALQQHNICILNLWRCDIGDEGFIALSMHLKQIKRLMKQFYIIMILAMKECTFSPMQWKKILH